MDPTAFNTYLISVCALALNLFFLTALTGVKRRSANEFVNPEDAKAFKGNEATQEAASVMRVQKAHRNALENILPFALLAGLYIATGAKPLAAAIYCYTFVAARWLHSICYLKGVQPFRTLTFTVAFLVNVGLTVQLLLHAFA